MMYICVTVCFVLKFSYCKSRSPLLAGDKRDLAKVGDRQTPDAVWSQNPDVIQDSLSPGQIIAKRAKDQLSVCAIAQGTVMYVFYFSPVSALFQ